MSKLDWTEEKGGPEKGQRLYKPKKGGRESGRKQTNRLRPFQKKLSKKCF